MKKGVAHKIVGGLVDFGITVVLHSWSLPQPECKLSAADVRTKTSERAVMCDWLMHTFSALGR